MLDKGGLTNWAVGLSVDDLKANVKSQLSTVSIVGCTGAHTIVCACFDTAAVQGELSPAWLEEAAAKARLAPDRFRDGAAQLGTRAHDAIDALVQGRDPGPVAADIQPIVDGFRRWHEQSGLTIDPRGDTMVASSRYQYAGALDALATDADGRVHIIDFKTSNSVHSSYALQLAAYVYAFAEMYSHGDIEAPVGALPHPVSAAGGSSISSFAPDFAPISQSPAAVPPPSSGGTAVQSHETSPTGDISSEHSAQDEDELPPWLQTPEMEATSGGGRRAAGGPARGSEHGTSTVQKRTVVRNRSASPRSRGSSVFGSPAGTGPIRSLCSSPGAPEVDAQVYPISALAAGATLREAASGAYATGAGQRSPLSLSGRVVRFDKRSGQAHEHLIGDLSVSFNAFKAALYLWRVNNMQSEALLSR